MEGARSHVSDQYSKIKKGSWFDQFCYGSNPWMARYVYGLMFLVANLLAWAVRDYGSSVLKEMKSKCGSAFLKFVLFVARKCGCDAVYVAAGLKECNGGEHCLGAEGVLRVSLGCSMFYLAMFLSTAGTSKLNDSREKWHSGWWSSKILMMVALILLPFLLPTEIISIYGQVAHFGAGVFLLIQLVSIICFITWLNDWCHSEKFAARCHIHVMLLATTAYILCILGIILMYIWYTPQTSCLLNIFFISWTLVLLQIMTSVSLHPRVNAGFLTPGFMGLYVVFLCWSAIRSEPPEAKCIRKSGAATSKGDVFTIISFAVAVLAIVIATFSTGIDSKCFQNWTLSDSRKVQFRKDDEEREEDVPYGYGFFHFVFATGGMYFAMLLIGWNTNHSMKKFTIDIGWTSTWVRIVNEWVATCVYGKCYRA
nr:probable serine incorporator [Ipomoea trifida]